MVSGIWQGFQNMKSWLEKNVRKMMSSIVSAVESEMQISSPSCVFAGIGRYMAQGLGAGFADEMRNVERSIHSATNSLAPKTATRQIDRQRTSGAFSLTQNIYTEETNYAAQQREASKRFKQIVREVLV
jgi:phage-related protein